MLQKCVSSFISEFKYMKSEHNTYFHLYKSEVWLIQKRFHVMWKCSEYAELEIYVVYKIPNKSVCNDEGLKSILFPHEFNLKQPLWKLCVRLLCLICVTSFVCFVVPHTCSAVDGCHSKLIPVRLKGMVTEGYGDIANRYVFFSIVFF